MRRWRRWRPSPALVVAMVALVVGLGGSAVAQLATTAKLDKREKKQAKKIANKQIKKKAPGLSVAGAETAKSVVDDSIDSSKIVDGQVGAADLGEITQIAVNGSVPNNDSESLNADCPAGTAVVSGGGGINLLGPPAGVAVTASLRVGNGWRIIVRNDSGQARNVFVQAQCLEE